MSNDRTTFDKANEDLLRLLKTVGSTNKIWEAYNIELTNSNTLDRIANNFYVEHFLLAAIVEAFLDKRELNLKELNEYTWNRIPKSFVWEIPVHIYHSTVIKAIKIGYISVSEKSKIDQPIFEITNMGFKILQDQTLQNLAATNFFNFQTNEFNKRAYKINRLAISIGIISLLAAILSLIVAIYALK